MIVDVGGVEAFAAAARRLGDSARAAGLAVPAFRSPPRVAGALRTIRRYPGGTVVSVQLRDRSHEAVAADMIEGVIAANGLTPPLATRVRTDLWETVTGGGAGSDAAWVWAGVLA